MTDGLTRTLRNMESCFEPHKQSMREPQNWLDHVDIVGDSSHLLALAAIPQGRNPPAVNAYLIEQIEGKIIDSYIFPPMVEAGWIDGVSTIYSTDLPRIIASISVSDGLRENSIMLNECEVALRQADMLASAQVPSSYSPATITTWSWRQDYFEHTLFVFDQACVCSKRALKWNHVRLHHVFISQNQIICIPKLVGSRFTVVSVFDLNKSANSGYFSHGYKIRMELSTPALFRVIGITGNTLHVLDMSKPLIVNIPLNMEETFVRL